MAIRKGYWDCPSCGRKKNDGPNEECPGCGNKRGKEVKFYLDDDSPVVTDPNELKRAKIGPDWNCEHCGAANDADRADCKSCGASKGSSHSNAVKDYVPPAPTSRNKSDKSDDYFDQPIARKTVPPRRLDAPSHRQEQIISSFPKKKILTYGGIGLGVMLLGLIAFLFLHTRDVPVQLTGVTWTREIQIEKFKTVVEEDWDIPSGGRKIGSETKIKGYVENRSVITGYQVVGTRQVKVGSHTEEVVCGQTDLGNGYFEDKKCQETVDDYEDEEIKEPIYQQDPVYAQWYTYEIERWKYERSVHGAGADQKVYWPEFTLADPKITQIGKERRGASKENYQASFRGGSKNKDYTLTFNYQRWSSLKIGSTYTGKMNVMGMLLGIEDPK